MYVKLLVLLFINLSLVAQAEEIYPEMPDYNVAADTLDPSLDTTEGIYEFHFNQKAILDNTREIIYAMDQGKNQTFKVRKDRALEIEATPGDHSFAFYLDGEYREIEIPRLHLQAQHRMVVYIRFKPSKSEQLVRKPVIYLYPEDTIDVSVEVLPKGDFTFTYPPIENGWNFTCAPNGTISDEHSTYPYLFWESKQEVKQAFFNPEEGAIVPGNEAVAYLEKQLTAFGMTSTERADFITYWGPILQTKTNLYIYLLFNEECDAFASLKINPTPESIARFYVLWTEVPSNYSPALKPQMVPVHQRNGFSVLEWGGVEFDASLLVEEEL